MVLKMTAHQLRLLRELEWQGGILIVRPEDGDAAYDQLVRRRYVCAEPAFDGRTRYEITMLGRRALSRAVDLIPQP